MARRLTVRLLGLDHVALKVRDQAASIAWYEAVLGLTERHREAWGRDPAMVCAGESCVALIQAEPGEAIAAQAGMAHVAFRVAEPDWEPALAALAARGIRYREEDHGIMRSVYFADPDGYEVELTRIVT